MEDIVRFTLDEVDIAILHELQQDSRLSVRELSSRVHRSSSAVFERLRRLERTGVIIGYTVSLDLDRTGRAFIVFCNVKMKEITTEMHERFSREVLCMPEVTECYNVSGDFDYLLKVQVPDMMSYRQFVIEKLGRLPMLASVQSVFAMQSIKQSTTLV